MDKKAQVSVGSIIMTFVVIIAAIALLSGGVFSNIGTMTQKVNYVNTTVTAPASAGQSITLVGQAATDVVVTNATSGTLIPASNYTIANYVVSNGQLVTTLTANTPNTIGWYGKSINVTYTSEPFGYQTGSGSRAMIGLIAIFSALAVAMVALTPVLKEKVLDMFG